MSFVTSRDGTKIGYETRGSGPPLLLVDGAMCHRTFGPMPDLAPLLTSTFTVVMFDRRGRGESGDTKPYAVEREVEDLQAVAAAIGQPMFVYGTSSGAVLAARAVAAGLPARKLVLHEPPLSLDGTNHPKPADYIEQCGAHIAAGRKGEATALFLRVVGMPPPAVWMMRNIMRGTWKKIVASEPTLMNDYAILGDTQRGGPLPDELATTLKAIHVPTLMLVGGKSPPYMHHAVKRVAESISGTTTTKVLPGQQHNVAAKAVAPELVAFFQ